MLNIILRNGLITLTMLSLIQVGSIAPLYYSGRTI